MIERRQFLAAAGIAALSPIARPVRALPTPAPAAPLLASNALALLRG
jgi:hypothetical protein